MLRKKYLKKIEHAFLSSSACAILGPRQCGKTTLAKQYCSKIKEDVSFFDLEDPLDLAKLDSPKLALEHLQGLIVIDEIQRRPDLFPVLRVLIDADTTTNQRFLLLGSASQDLIRQSSETLAGRITYVELPPFTLEEVGNEHKLLTRGGFPRSYLSRSNDSSMLWRKSYIRNFLERDIRSFGFNIPPKTMRRFWMMIAHYHGQIFNASELARSINISPNTASKYLDILAGTFMVRRLSPWFENLSKRQVKSPKLYFRDVGLLETMLGIHSYKDLYNNPKVGPIWEGFALEEIIKSLEVEDEDCYFWGTQGGAELDLLISTYGRKEGYEFKYTDSPKVTKSMHVAIEDLKLSKLTVIIPGDDTFSLADNITVCGLSSFVKAPNKLLTVER